MSEREQALVEAARAVAEGAPVNRLAEALRPYNPTENVVQAARALVDLASIALGGAPPVPHVSFTGDGWQWAFYHLWQTIRALDGEDA